MAASHTVMKFGRLPWGLIGMLGCVLAAESYVTRHDLDFAATTVSYEWRITGRSAQRQPLEREVLIFGDSLLKWGLAPLVFQDRIGQRAHNLALSGGQAPATYFLLRKALDSGARPSAVVVDFKWTALAVDHRLNERVLPEAFGPRECLDLAWTARDTDLLGSLMLAEALPSVRARHELRASIMAAIRGESASIRQVMRPVRRTWAVNRGAHIVPSEPAFSGTVNPDDKALFPDAWAPDPTNVAYVERFLRLAAGRGIRVFWLLPPISPAAQARREQIGADAAYARFVDAMTQRHRNVVVVDGRNSGYDRSAFFDSTHLNRRGTATLSADVATIVGEHLGAEPPPPWLRLPAFREQPAGVALEDVGQSRVAVDNAGVLTR